MGPGARIRFRRWTAALAILWALVSLVVGLRAKLDSYAQPSFPFSVSSAAGVNVINAVTPRGPSGGRPEPGPPALDRRRAP